MIKKIIKKILPKRVVFVLEKSIGHYNALNKTEKNLIFLGSECFIDGKCSFEKPVYASGKIYFRDVCIGKFTSFFGTCKVNNCEIGKFCSVADGVKMGLDAHPSKTFVSTSPLFYMPDELFFGYPAFADKEYFKSTTTTVIGNDVWIGTNCLIKGGIKIGDGAMIGAGAVVTKNVEPYAIVGGVPAKLIRYRFTPEQIKFLLDFKWWDKPEDWLKKNHKDFLDIETLFKKYHKEK